MVRPTRERYTSPTVKSSNERAATGAIVPRGSSRHVRERVLRQAEQAFVELAYAGLHFAMAIRAEHHALGKLGDDRLPAACDAVLADTKVFGRAVAVMELEDRRESGPPAPETCGSHVGDGLFLGLPTVSDHAHALDGGVFDRVPDAVTVCAEEIALLGLCRQLHPRSAESTDRELFLRGIAMVEIERLKRPGVSTINTTASSGRHELRLHGTPSLLLIAVDLRVSASPTVLDELLRIEVARWLSRTVVDPER